jgi:hypothetical protein
MRLLLLAAMFALTACATPALDAIAERLDERSGTTLTQLRSPLTFVAEAARGAGRDPFAFLGPFETNRMGTRQMHLWAAIPVESGVADNVTLWLDQQPLATTARSFAAADAGLAAPPYPLQAQWQRAFHFDLDAGLLERLAGSDSLVLEVTLSDGSRERFRSERSPAAAFQRFRSQVGL